MNKLNKQNRDTLIISRMTAKRGRVAGGRIKQKEKRTHRHGQMCGDYGGEINGNERIQ